MPHCIIEYARSLESRTSIKQVCEALHQAVLGTALFKEPSIRVRAIAYDEALVGGEADVPFVHVQAYLFAGRDEAQREAFAQAIEAALLTTFGTPLSVSVNPVEINQQTYRQNTYA
ncbi:5-carboxymethyl-2-hydroxymuconate Delta-isomerase [Suttonella sp. R2A3]|uniref:5-carboxymethyl-2-hydroxymuconate Delta-isomerase n=1 Tax=Suttonella sp. R2A3 TaxID=2908648 RepID=UPI001F2693A9|nr:5-carboxymethyl-2-hydroxymuconate Delta-isomerase [Suttonella sp. R2A3]UJF24112.1 5-carboxymethyl-2-hydroxymuconate Delta-isomerase [Suttonella sp. R2A3]